MKSFLSSPSTKNLVIAFTTSSLVLLVTVLTAHTETPQALTAALMIKTSSITTNKPTTAARAKVNAPAHVSSSGATPRRAGSSSSRQQQFFYGGRKSAKTVCVCTCYNTVDAQLCAMPPETYGGLGSGQCNDSEYGIDALPDTDCASLNNDVMCTGYLTERFPLPGLIQNCYKEVTVD